MNQTEILKKWEDYFNNANLSGILNLYDPKSIFIPTFSSEIRYSRNQIKEYLTNLIEEQKASVEIVLNSIIEDRISENIHLLCGYYTFKIKKDEKINARFSFVINPISVNPIKHHHSSPINATD